jgi:glutamate N-acetyltransferase/amino-acid N-acetyltransferase
MRQNLTDVRGFTCWGSHVGIKSKRRDLAIIYSEVPASAAAVFTRNIVIAEPLKVSKRHIEDGIAQAFVINAGNANACTGEQGRKGAEKMAKVAAKELDVRYEDVIISSTGVIGREFPTEKVVKGIKGAVKNLTDRHVAGSFAANAILTTDTFAKETFSSFLIDDETEINMGGICKGSGMIHPNMGTMLGFIICDIAIEPKLLQETLADVVEKTFNMISVDGDTSTNDMVAIMCNGMAANEMITDKNSQAYKIFKGQLVTMCMDMAKLIVSDGEGATKFIQYTVLNAPSTQDARQVVKTIATSALVKTAIFGLDPNWGRIIAAAGRAGVTFNPDKIDLFIGNNKSCPILQNGQPVNPNMKKLSKLMKSTQIFITLDLKAGSSHATGWGTDFSYEYVKINAEYTT